MKPDDDQFDELDEEIYMSNVSAMRGGVEPIYASRGNVHDESIYSSVGNLTALDDCIVHSYFFSTLKTCRENCVHMSSFSRSFEIKCRFVCSLSQLLVYELLICSDL